MAAALYDIWPVNYDLVMGPSNLEITFIRLLSTLLIYSALTFLIVGLLDFIIARPVSRYSPTKENNSSTRWFLLHGLFNAGIVLITAQGALYVFLNPLSVFDIKGTAPTGLAATIAIGAFHFYHMLLFPLTMEDIIHHTVNAGLNVIIGVMIPVWGYLLDLVDFDTCGFPGGIDYFMLFAVKMGWMHSMTEKRINRVLNLVIRWPLMFLAFYIAVINLYQGRGTQNVLAILMMLLAGSLHLFNAFYYADKVTGNYHVKAAQQPQRSRS